MARLLYFDCASGISGDMVLGALIDAGLPLDELKQALGSLALEDVAIQAVRVLRSGVSATKFSVQHAHVDHDDHEHGHKQHRDHEHHHDPHHHDHHHDHQLTHNHAASHARGSSTHTHAHRSLAEIAELIDKSALSPPGRDRAKALFQRLG
jgi:uncharacterized protein (DUF111 family)